ncbi:unnamed protein product [Moneuplotes crassus]|uniref:Uncharacterized protein n=1 Tax=Euplotes crassus TaxID=5936 RepID=A0AAD1XKR5_EUPCR|nr:unnamed protein product [Moneuplotes crassus]
MLEGLCGEREFFYVDDFVTCTLKLFIHDHYCEMPYLDCKIIVIGFIWLFCITVFQLCLQLFRYHLGCNLSKLITYIF